MLPFGLQRVISLDASSDPSIMPPALAEEASLRRSRSLEGRNPSRFSRRSSPSRDFSTLGTQQTEACLDISAETHREPKLGVDSTAVEPAEMQNEVKHHDEAMSTPKDGPPPVLPPQPEDLALACRSHSTPNMNVVAFESRTERLLNQHKRLEEHNLRMDSPRTSLGCRTSPPMSRTLNPIPSCKVVSQASETDACRTGKGREALVKNGLRGFADHGKEMREGRSFLSAFVCCLSPKTSGQLESSSAKKQIFEVPKHIPLEEEVVGPLTAADLLRKSVTLLASSGSRSMLSALCSSDQLLEPEAEAHPVFVLAKSLPVTTTGGDQAMKDPAGGLSLQPIKEMVAVITKEPAQRKADANASSRSSADGVDKVVYEDQAETLKDDNTLSTMQGGLSTYHNHHLEMLLSGSPDKGPLETGILMSSSGDPQSAAVVRESIEELSKLPQEAEQGVKTEHDVKYRHTAAAAPACTLDEKRGTAREGKGEDQDTEEALTTAEGTEQKPSNIIADESSLQQLDTKNGSGEIIGDRQEVELLDEIDALSGQAMTRTLKWKQELGEALLKPKALGRGKDLSKKGGMKTDAKLGAEKRRKLVSLAKTLPAKNKLLCPAQAGSAERKEINCKLSSVAGKPTLTSKTFPGRQTANREIQPTHQKESFTPGTSVFVVAAHTNTLPGKY